MRGIIKLFVIGLVVYLGYGFWNNPDELKQRISGLFGGDAASERKESTAQTGTPTGDSANSRIGGASVLVQEAVTFAYQSMGTILSPISGTDSGSEVGKVSQLKVRLNSEIPRQHTVAERTKLQTALQLVNILDQAVTQRADHIRQRKSSEYHDGVEGTSSSSKTKAKIPDEILDQRIRRAEFFKRGVERKWDDLATQYRVTIERLLVSLSS